MNQFKKDLNHELQAVVLSQEKKQLIATKAKAEVKKHSQKKWINWQYQFVLTAFTFLLLGFGYLLLQQGESISGLQGAAPFEPTTSINWSMLNHDFVKIIIFIVFFVVLRTVIKKRIQKNGKGLPVCVECGEGWSFRDALKQCMKNGNITCPNCSHKQYRTKKSSLKVNLLNIPIPFMVVVPHLFDNYLLGIAAYLFCAAYLLFSLNPYFMELQENDSINESLW